VILCFRRGGAAERQFWTRTLADGDVKDGDLEHAIGLMQKHKAIEATLSRARHYGAIARDALAIFPESDPRNALSDVVSFCVSRTH
jgi:octaprenyl-diphosphate synthase